MPGGRLPSCDERLSWEGILTKVASLSEHARVLKEKERVGERLRRLGRAFIDGLIDESDSTVQKKLLQDRLDSLVIPEAEAAFDAGEMLENLGPVWQQATLEEKNGLLASMLEAVYLDLAASKSVVGIVPKSAFYPLFESLLDESAGRVRVYKPNPQPGQEGTGESPLGDEGGEGQEILSWWRRGRVELPVQKLP